MIKRFLLTILGLLLVVGAIAGVKYLQIRAMIDKGAKMQMPPETITAAPVQSASWEETLTAVGTLEAVQGVTVAAELSGKVVRIVFEPGATVKKDDLLVQLDTSAEEAQLRALQTNSDLARTNQGRMADLVGKGIIAQADYDKAEADFKQSVAQTDNIRAAIGKKTIRAPFAGRLGTRKVNLGQMLHDGDPIVSLQVLDPIFVNFQLPQQELGRVGVGMTVRLQADTLAGRQLSGQITTINPEVDATNRNIRLQATVANSDELLRPGMFVNLALVLPGEQQVITLPSTSVLYAPYGDSVFVVEEKRDEKSGTVGKALRQQFVRLGERRGDFVAVTDGVKEGATVASTGVFKLRNGQAVVIDNTLSPEFKVNPKPENN